ncbi:MAG: acyl carrier protein [Clostridia bacterium]|nr:acyl carrier protein [Clostridia bacterium]
MTRQEIFNRLKGILVLTDDSSRQGIDDLEESASLMTDLGFSSVTMLYMVIAIEEEFGIRFDDNIGAADFETLGDVISYIEKKLA